MGALDPAIVDQLQALARAGNSQLLDRLQASFTRDTPLRVQALRAAVAAGDAEAVAFNAHTLKGSAANLGATEMVETCVQIEATSPDARPGSSNRCSGSSSGKRSGRKPRSRAWPTRPRQRGGGGRCASCRRRSESTR